MNSLLTLSQRLKLNSAGMKYGSAQKDVRTAAEILSIIGSWTELGFIGRGFYEFEKRSLVGFSDVCEEIKRAYRLADEREKEHSVIKENGEEMEIR